MAKLADKDQELQIEDRFLYKRQTPSTCPWSDVQLSLYSNELTIYRGRYT